VWQQALCTVDSGRRSKEWRRFFEFFMRSD
jgi:hypothetical protein